MSLVNCRALTGSRDLQAHHYVERPREQTDTVHQIADKTARRDSLVF